MPQQTSIDREQDTYTPPVDVTETLPNGQVKVIARAGVPIPLAEARRLGLVKDRKHRGPAEHKAAGEVVDGRFVPSEDITQALPDGRTIQVGLAGVPMDVHEARRYGLLPPLDLERPYRNVVLGAGFERAPRIDELGARLKAERETRAGSHPTSRQEG